MQGKFMIDIWRDWKIKERLFEILGKPKQFLRDNEKLILEKNGVRVVLYNDGEVLSIYEEEIS